MLDEVDGEGHFYIVMVIHFFHVLHPRHQLHWDDVVEMECWLDGLFDGIWLLLQPYF